MHFYCADFDFCQGATVEFEASYNKCNDDLFYWCLETHFDEEGNVAEEKECNTDDYNPEMWAAIRDDKGWDKPEYRDWARYWDRMYGFDKDDHHDMDHDDMGDCEEVEI